jgi:ABC-type phosphate transport system substrate-binding protein
MPKTLGSEAEVAAFVAKTKGAIGYVGAGTPTPGTKTLEVK